MSRENGFRGTAAAWGWIAGIILAASSVLAQTSAPPEKAVSPSPSGGHKVLILGDSIMKSLSFSLEREFAKCAGVSATSYSAIGTGLARLDLFNWHKQISALTTERKPDSAVIMMGANDDQPMKTTSGIVNVGTPEWEKEYGRRVAQAMDLLVGGGVEHVYWIQLPDMREPSGNWSRWACSKRRTTRAPRFGRCG